MLQVSRPPAPRFSGYGVPGKVYDSGEIVLTRGVDPRVKISKVSNNVFGVGGDWADLGSPGASPRNVLHRWNPQPTCYPDIYDRSVLSDPADVCHDCWKDGDFRNAFKPEVHFYLIREPGL